MRKFLYKQLSKIIFILLVLILAGCSKEKMNLKNEQVTVEYGEPISMDVNDYLDNQESFLSDVKMHLDLQDLKADGVSYYPVGDYKAIFTHGEDSCTVIIQVRDTVKPEFQNLKDNYHVNFGEKFDVKELAATDLSKVVITVNDKNVNYSKSGTYVGTIVAKDESGNECKQEINIIVDEEKKQEKSSSTSSSKSKSSSTKNKSSSTTNENNQSKSKSENSSSNSEKTDSSSANNSQILDSKRDENSYTEFNNGNNYGWSGSFELPEE